MYILLYNQLLNVFPRALWTALANSRIHREGHENLQFVVK